MDSIWLGIGLLGQAFFTSRFLIQWIASERQKKSVVPALFWYCSIVGGGLYLPMRCTAKTRFLSAASSQD